MYWLSFVVLAIILIGLIYARISEMYLTQTLIIQNLVIFMIVNIPGYSNPYIINNVFYDLAGRAVYVQQPSMLLGKSHTFISLMYLHANFMHIIGNLLVLFFIGIALEDRIGKEYVALVYFPAGIVATLSQYFVDWGSLVLNVGASGAVMALMGTIVYMFPKDKITMFLGPILMRDVRVDLAVGVFIVMMTVIAFLGGSSNVAHAAHFGGFGAGMLMGYIYKKYNISKDREESLDYSKLKKLAEEQGLMDIYQKIEDADENDVKKAWADELLRKAKCPECGRKLKGSKCECGYDPFKD
ncbi:MAG: rhomboid family intramembrane serine protease [Thermoplasmata archaeon]